MIITLRVDGYPIARQTAPGLRLETILAYEHHMVRLVPETGTNPRAHIVVEFENVPRRERRWRDYSNARGAMGEATNV